MNKVVNFYIGIRFTLVQNNKVQFSGHTIPIIFAEHYKIFHLENCSQHRVSHKSLLVLSILSPLL